MPPGKDSQKTNSGRFKKGDAPHNHGVQSTVIKMKIKRFNEGLPNTCKKHGEHYDWRLHSKNNVQCRLCSSDSAKNSRKNNPIKYLLKDAKHRKIGFNLDEKYIAGLLAKQKNKCALTGLEFINGITPSLDRINSALGYIKGNVQLVLFDVNRMKTNFNQDWFIYLCHLISKNKTQ